MPTVMSHAAVAWGLARAVRPWSPDPALASARERTAAVLAMLPDADVLAFLVGIPYEHALGHRGLSHSLLAAVALGVGAWLLLRHTLRSAQGATPGALDLAVLVAAAASHGLLDMLTDGGLVVGLFLPFEGTRWFWPRTPIPVSPIGLLSFFAWGLPVLAWELALLWPVALAGAGLAHPARPRVRALIVAGALLVLVVAWVARLRATAWDQGR